MCAVVRLVNIIMVVGGGNIRSGSLALPLAAEHPDKNTLNIYSKIELGTSEDW